MSIRFLKSLIVRQNSMPSTVTGHLDRNKQVEIAIVDSIQRISEVKKREWQLANYAILSIGALYVLLSNNMTTPYIKYIIGVSGTGIFCGLYYLTEQTSIELERNRRRLTTLREKFYDDDILNSLGYTTKARYLKRKKYDPETLIITRIVAVGVLIILWVKIFGFIV